MPRPSSSPAPASFRARAALVGFPACALGLVGIYAVLARQLGPDLAYFAGFGVYWLLAVALSLSLVEPRSWAGLLAPRPLDRTSALLLLAPPVAAGVARLTGHLAPLEGSMLAHGLVAVMNGIVEEALWRGVALRWFHMRPFAGAVWPSIWFAVWHVAPGSLDPGSSLYLLVLGALGLGLAMSWLAHRTNTILWCIVSHTVAGLIVTTV